MSGSFGFDLPHAHFPGTVEAQMSCAAKKYQSAKMQFRKPKLKLYYAYLPGHTIRVQGVVNAAAAVLNECGFSMRVCVYEIATSTVPATVHIYQQHQDIWQDCTCCNSSL
jgi:hypothetical protein